MSTKRLKPSNPLSAQLGCRARSWCQHKVETTGLRVGSSLTGQALEEQDTHCHPLMPGARRAEGRTRELLDQGDCRGGWEKEDSKEGGKAISGWGRQRWAQRSDRALDQIRDSQKTGRMGPERRGWSWEGARGDRGVSR